MLSVSGQKIIGIAAKPGNSQSRELAWEFIGWLKEHQLRYKVDHVIAPELGLTTMEPDCVVKRQKLMSQCDPVVIFGGDGTLISVCRHVNSHTPVVVGVNVGTLGFLTEASIEEFYPLLESVLDGSAQIVRKQLLEGELQRGGEVIMKFNAINDVVIGKGALGRIYGLDLYINEEAAARFRGDGIIVATPTGSTAYSLAAGGSIVHPRVSAMIVTPICSHFLASRPIVLPGDAKMLIKIAEDPISPETSVKKMFLTIDGQEGKEILVGDEVHVSMSNHSVLLAKSPSKNYFDVLTTKLKWGVL